MASVTRGVRSSLTRALRLLSMLSVVAGCGAAAGSAATTGPSSSATTFDAPPTGSSTSVEATTTIELDCSDTTATRQDFSESMHTAVPFTKPVTAITPDSTSRCDLANADASGPWAGDG